MNKQRWGYRFSMNHTGATDESFDRYKQMAEMSKAGRGSVARVSYIRNHDREMYDEIERKLRAKELKDVPV